MVKTIRFVKRGSRHTFRNRGGAAMAAASDRHHTAGVDCLGGIFFEEDIPILYKSFAVSGIFKNEDIKRAFDSFFNHDENKISFNIKKKGNIKIITVLNEHPETNLAYIEILSELQYIYPIQIVYHHGRWLYERTPDHEDDNAAFLDPPQTEGPGVVDTIHVRLHPQKVHGLPYPKKPRIPRTRHTSRRGPMPRHERLLTTRSRSRTRSKSRDSSNSISTHSSSSSSDNSISSRSDNSISSRSR